MKKTNNKGFSLVELIIVIAIMAILAGAIAPALIRYIDKSRKSNDVSSCKTIKTAVETALGNEDVYAFLTNCGDDDADFTLITFNPGESTSTATMTNDAMTISGCEEPTTGVSVADVGTISRIIQNRLEDERRGKGGTLIERKLRRKIQDKKEGLGIKEG